MCLHRCVLYRWPSAGDKLIVWRALIIITSENNNNIILTPYRYPATWWLSTFRRCAVGIYPQLPKSRDLHEIRVRVGGWVSVLLYYYIIIICANVYTATRILQARQRACELDGLVGISIILLTIIIIVIITV